MTNQTSDDLFSTPEYRHSRRAYALQCTFEYLIALLVADAFLAKLLSYLGLDAATTGVISSFVSLAFTVQIFSVFLSRKKRNAKKLSVTLNSIGQLLFLILYLIPFTPIRGTSVKILVMVIILSSYALQYLVATILYRWANSFVNAKCRAVFGSKREILSLISGMVFTAAVGYVFDKYEADGNIEGGFLFIAILLLILAAANFICLLLIGKEPQEEDLREATPLSEALRNTLGNKSFRSVILMTVLWECAKYFSVGFLGIYKTGDLMISVFLIQLFNILGSGARVLVSKPFGRFSDRTSFAKGIEVALGIAAVAFSFVVFTTPKTWYFIIPYTVLYAICMAGVNANSFNISYSYVDSKFISEAMAIKNLIGGFCGFGTSLLGAKLLKYISENGNVFLGIHVYGQQVLAVCSLLFTLGAFLVVKLIIEKQKIKKQ